MEKTASNLLKLLFNDNEKVYASPDKYSSIKNQDGSWRRHLLSVPRDSVDLNNTMLVGINPIDGDSRSDDNVTAYRNFLIEIDDLPLKDQPMIIKESGLPFSACVFSGNKSFHWVVSLEKSLPNIETYRHYAKWLIATVKNADKGTFPPSKGLRFPGFIRPETGKEQKLIHLKSRISFNTLQRYLSSHVDKMPRYEVQVQEASIDESIDAKDKVRMMSDWVLQGIASGFTFDEGRNNRWYSVGFEFGKVGLDKTDMFSVLSPLFTPDRDFSTSEWRSALTSGWKNGRKKSRSVL